MPEYKKIPLTRGKFSLVDTEDFEKVSKFNWRYNGSGHNNYAIRNVGKTTQSLHRLILGLEDSKKQIDHINNDGLDNRKSNLRIASKSENGMNKGKSRTNKSGFKGVVRRKDRWWSRITVNGKRYHVGYFVSLVDAAKAYDKAAKKHHGKFARLNFQEKNA